MGCLGGPFLRVLDRDDEMKLAVTADILMCAPKSTPSILEQIPNCYRNGGSC